MPSGSPPMALAKRKADMALMPPPLLPKKIKRPPIVLEEDVYTDALSYIIARDFFPGLLESRAQQEYLDALDAKDDEWIREAGENLRAAMTPGPAPRTRSRTAIPRTPATVATTLSPAATPARHPQGVLPARTPTHGSLANIGDSQPAVDLSLSLHAFQAKYTSEDNASFNDVLDAQNLARARKYAHLRNHTNSLPSKRRLAQEMIKAQKLLTSGHETDSAARPSQDLNLRPASYDSFPTRQGGRNALMFTPDGAEQAIATQTTTSSSSAPSQQTNFSATRLPGPEASVPESPSFSAIDAAVSGRPRLSGSEAGSIVDGSMTPRVNGWAFVDEEPTAGEVAATSTKPEDLSHLLPTRDGSGLGFRMSEPSKREGIHRRLVEKSAERERRSQRASIKDGNLTPAARNLASKMGTPATGRGFGSSQTKGRTWTPLRTPMRKS